jgi:hypothetical protein
MLNILRLTLLIVSLGTVGFLWGYRTHPEWIDGFDRWICERHLDDSRALWNRVQAFEASEGSGPDGLHVEVESHLKQRGQVHSMEREFPLWRNLVIWYVAEASKWGEWDRALQWQGVLMTATPHDMDQGLVQINALMQRGRPMDWVQAREALDGIRRGLPEWEPALEMEMRFDWKQQAWVPLVEALRQWQGLGGQDWVEGWQWFFRSEGQAKTQSTALQSAVRAPGGEAMAVQWTPLEAGRLEYLRFDPPRGAAGRLRPVRCVGVAHDGAQHELRVVQAKDCEWSEQDRSLLLTGLNDPRLTLALPGLPMASVQVQFQFIRPTPDWILEGAKQHPELARLLGELPSEVIGEGPSR